MSNKNEDDKFIINNDEQNKVHISLPFNENATESQIQSSDPFTNFTGKVIKNINAKENNLIENSIINIYNSNTNQINENLNISGENNLIENNIINICNSNTNQVNENLNILGERNLIFQVNKRIIHSGNDKDNVRIIIIRDFITLFITFVNYIIRIINGNDNFEFQICYQLKSKIKLEDIIIDTVKNLLSSFAIVKDKKKGDKDNNIENKDNENIVEFIKKLPSSLDILFNKHVIDIFKDIYAKNIHNETDKVIDLNNYGLRGKVFILDEKVHIYQKLRDKYKNNKIKILLMDQIVDSLKNPPKKNMFKIKKKK